MFVNDLIVTMNLSIFLIIILGWFLIGVIVGYAKSENNYIDQKIKNENKKTNENEIYFS